MDILIRLCDVCKTNNQKESKAGEGAQEKEAGAPAIIRDRLILVI